MEVEINVQDILETRRWTYSLLSKGFYLEPSPEGLVAGYNPLVRLAGELENGHVGLNFLVDFFNAAPGWDETQWRELRSEYQRLFVGPDALPAPPWESVYRSEEHVILDEHTLAVREFYRAWGLEPQKLNQEPDDHVGLELEFMALLTERTSAALAESNTDAAKELIEAQVRFLEEHVLCWIEPFCTRLAQGTDNGLYKGLALFTPDYVRMDAEMLCDILDQWVRN